MAEHLQSGDQTMAPEDSAWQAMPHFCEIGCTCVSSADGVSDKQAATMSGILFLLELAVEAFRASCLCSKFQEF